jgi:hypothetical protein
MVVVLSIAATETASASTLPSKHDLTRRLVVVPADMPPGYQASAGSIGDPKIFAKIARCTRTPIKRTLYASAGGPTLTNHDSGATVNSTVDVVPTKKMSDVDQSVLENPEFPGCLARVVQSQLAAQGVENIGGTSVSVPKVGDFSRAVQLDLSGTNAGQPQRIAVTDVFIRRGRAEITIGFTSRNDQPFDPTVVQSVLEKLDRRLQRMKI